MPLIETFGSGGARGFGFGGEVFIPFSETFVSLFGSTPSRTAPASLGSYYSSSLLNNQVTLSSGKQLWTVPYTGMYRLKAFGAQGGSGGIVNLRGGGGASVQGDFLLTQGEIIQVLCGSTGGYRDDNSYITSDGCDSGGGGGTYVVRSPYNNQESVLLAAAGGGGSGNLSFFKSPLSSAQGVGSRSNLVVDGSVGGASGMDGQGGTSGVNGIRSSAGVNGYSGQYRNLGGSNTQGQSGNTNGGNGGGGFFTDSNSGRLNETWATTSFGWAYLDGSNGGTSDHPNSFGGFGGGGGGHGNCYISGGGGGGWNGGGNQWQYWNRHAGCGGGSLNNGSNPINVSGANYESSGVGAFGKVEVTRLQ
jgi:hypothetical protein